MLLKKRVSLNRKKDGGFCLVMDGRETCVKSEHVPIMEAIKNGCTDNEALTRHIMEKEGCSRAAAGFILADCILSYPDHIEKDNSCYIID